MVFVCVCVCVRDEECDVRVMLQGGELYSHSTTRTPTTTDTHKDRSNLFANKSRWGLDIVVGHEPDVVLNVLNAKGQTDPDAKGAMIVDIDGGQVVHDNSWPLCERHCLHRRCQASAGLSQRRGRYRSREGTHR